jgi:uncharacterized protein DUF4143
MLNHNVHYPDAMARYARPAPTEPGRFGNMLRDDVFHFWGLTVTGQNPLGCPLFYHFSVGFCRANSRTTGVQSLLFLVFLKSTYRNTRNPLFENMGKRQYKAPKVYVRDSGLLHALLEVASQSDLEGHPKYGASWEGFALEQILAVTGADQAFCWGTHAGAELDLLLIRRGRRYGIEVKAAAAPPMTKSLHVALTDLELERAWIVHPGSASYPLHETGIPMAQLTKVDPEKGGQDSSPPLFPPTPPKNPPHSQLPPLAPGSLMGDIPIVLPNLDVATLRVPFPMSEEGFKTLVNSLATIKDALVKKKK